MRPALLAPRLTRGAALALLIVGMSGCGSPAEYPPNFAFPSRTDRLVLKLPETPPTSSADHGEREAEIARLDSVGGKTLDPTSAPSEIRTAIDHALRELFGTPAESRVLAGTDAGIASAANRLGLTPELLTEGGKLFRRNCLQCHNITGDGRGPAGNVNPYPRDFRRGVFKFTSTGVSGKPRREDILRTLSEGLKGTAMPSFALLPERDRELLAGYVTYLALRGHVEFQTYATAISEGSKGILEFATNRLRAELNEWEQAQASPPIPSPPDDGDPGSSNHQAAVKRGFEIFTRKAENSCITCHGEFGRKPAVRYDLWGTIARPADLTLSGLKGGSRPEDVFARIRSGILAVGMPAHPELTDRQIWDLVRLVKSLPFMRELPPEVRAAVYPNP